MEQMEQPETFADPLLACCLCTSLLRDAVQLACLHNCCRPCFSTAASKSSSESVTCVSCGTVTQVGGEQPNGFIDGQVQCYALIAESGVCGVCTEKGEHDKSAVVWCITCRHSLCEDCVNEHKVNNIQHTMQCLEELKSLDELCSQATAIACAIHKRPLDFACLSCEQAKCSSCWATCMKSKHETHIVGDESFEKYVGNLVNRISTLESELLRKSVVLLENPRSFLRLTKVARDRHLNDLEQRKRRIMDAVEVAYRKMESAAKNAYDDLKAKGDDAAATADRIASDLSVARTYIRRLLESNDKCEIFKQQKIIQERLSVLSAQLDMWSGRLSTKVCEVKIEASLPEDLEEVVGSWIGEPQVCSASSSLLQQLQLPQCYSFGAASASVQLPVACWDIAMTKDGRSLLLAAEEHGLIEYSSSSGRELSRWLPPKHIIVKAGDVVVQTNDLVPAVVALSDGRAAVSLRFAQCVVLLRRRGERHREKDGGRAAVSNWWQRLVVAAGGDSWTELLRVQLPLSPQCLSAHGEVLAVSEADNCLVPTSGRLQLLSLSGGQRLSSELQCEYGIRSLAVTTRAVVTGSGHKVERGFGRRAAYVLDAHSLADDGSDKRLWRYVLSSSDVKEEEQLWGICADSSGGFLYAAVCRCDNSSGRVSELSMADGSELRCVALSFGPTAAPVRPLLLPRRLSLSDDATLSSSRLLLLAALCWDSKTKERRTVTVHRSASDELP